MKHIAVGLVMLAACGDNQTGVTITLPGTPSFVMYEVDGAWKHPLVIPSSDGPPTYEIDAFGPYRFVWVCAGPLDQTTRGYFVDELFADYADGDQAIPTTNQYIPYACYNPPGLSRDGTAIGRVAQAGVVEVGSLVDGSSNPDWLFTLIAPVGPHDVVYAPSSSYPFPEVGSPSRIVVRRDVPFTKTPPAPQPTIDLATESLARSSLAIELPPNAPRGVGWSSVTYLVDHGDWSRIGGASGGIDVFPLDADLRQVAELQIITSGAIQRAAFDIAGPRPALLPPVPAVSFPARAQVNWQHEAIDATRFELALTSGSETLGVGYRGAMTARGREAFGATLDLEVDDKAPGFLDAWRVLPIGFRELAVYSGGDDGVSYTTIVDEASLY